MPTPVDQIPIYTPASLPRSFSDNKGPKAFKSYKPAKTGNFDLDTQRGSQMARLKASVNLAGKTSYLCNIVQSYLCEAQKPPQRFIHELEFWTVNLTETPGKPDVVTQHASLTRIPLDFDTLEPIASMLDPVSGRRLEAFRTMFSISLPIDLSHDAAPDRITQPGSPYVRIGDEVEIIWFDPREGDNVVQPRVDTNTWRVNYAELMDPARKEIRGDSYFTGVQPASVFEWAGYEKDDPVQLMRHKTGTRTQSVDALPQIARELIVPFHEDRI